MWKLKSTQSVFRRQQSTCASMLSAFGADSTRVAEVHSIGIKVRICQKRIQFLIEFESTFLLQVLQNVFTVGLDDVRLSHNFVNMAPSFAQLLDSAIQI